MTGVQRLARWCPLDAISFEAVRFHSRLLQNPAVVCVEYQQGTLAGTEMGNISSSNGGVAVPIVITRPPRPITARLTIFSQESWRSNRPSNLALSCHAYNQAKGDQTAEEFGHPEVQAQAKPPQGCGPSQQHPAVRCTNGC